MNQIRAVIDDIRITFHYSGEAHSLTRSENFYEVQRIVIGDCIVSVEGAGISAMNLDGEVVPVVYSHKVEQPVEAIDMLRNLANSKIYAPPRRSTFVEDLKDL